MSSWSSRRKSRIALTFLALAALVLIAVYFFIFYKAPTCFDSIKNGGELGVDCGGACQKLCQSAFIMPKIVWGGGKSEMVAPSLYNVSALVANPNTNVAALNVPYKFALFDNKGLLIVEKTGRTTIPAHRNILVFDTAINTGKRIPTKVTFEFTAQPEWFKSHDTLEALAITDKKYSEDENNSSLEITLENKGLRTISDITVGAVLYDIDGNAIGFSRTSIDALGAGAQEIAPFTWPLTRNDKVVSIEALPVVSPIRD